MFLLSRPSAVEISRFLARQRQSTLSYQPVGLSRLSPVGYNVDEQRVRIGHGRDAFERAKVAIESWSMFRLGWVELHPERAPTVPGTDVAVVVRHFGFWSLNGCRVVTRLPASADDLRYGFSYGTLQDHGAVGEELFAVELNPIDGSVVYEIRAVSRPRAVLARLGYPLSRWLQRRFRIDSANAMAVAVRGRTGPDGVTPV